MNTNVLCAVFRRNFVSYFASPTGYVFICVFVILSTVAAFWPDDFFNTNLANLDQLNRVFPWIMLIFVPAITMSVWADERRQGTDELLLTIPAGDLDIVLGKYLAAVAIYTASLGFSLVCNASVLAWLGSPDPGLLLGTYFGYWLVGLAMLAVGMVASFLTGNLTVAFILGAVFNAPLVFTQWTIIASVPAKALGWLNALLAVLRLPHDALAGWEQQLAERGNLWARGLEQWCIPAQFRDFGRGVVSLAGVVYFLLIVAIMLYLSMVLISRRHWHTGREQRGMAAHYTARAVSMAVVALGLTTMLGRHDPRLDVTAEGINSVSDETYALLRGLDPQRPVVIEAFVSPKVPEAYVQTRLNLVSMLREIEKVGGRAVRVTINDTDRFSEEAVRAEKRYGIGPRGVTTMERGALAMDQIFLGVAVSRGLQKVVIPFIDRGIPIEYELVRSIATVTQQQRKKVGILATDAPIYGQFNFQTMSSSGDWPIVAELQKQYEVVRVDPAQPINEKYDVLLAVQPSSLGPEEMDRLIAAIESGQPTAIFEDPFPVFAPSVPATSRPRNPPGGMNPMMMMGGMQSPPKGDINKLWRLLGIDFSADEVVWQDYNPYRKATHFPREFVFVDEDLKKVGGAREPFNPEHPVTSKLQHMLFPFPGWIAKLNRPETPVVDLKVTPLVQTGVRTGKVRFDEIIQMTPLGPRGGLNPNRRQIPTDTAYLLAAHIRGKFKPAAATPETDASSLPVPTSDTESTGGAGAPVAQLADDGTPGEPARNEASPPSDASIPPMPDSPAADATAPEESAPAQSAPTESTPVAGEKTAEQPGAAAAAGATAPGGAGSSGADSSTAPPEKSSAPPAPTAPPNEVEINVIVVADIDMLSEDFFRLREQGDIPEANIRFDFDNVPFVLNVLDQLAGDERFLELRKRRPQHRTLTRIEEKTHQAREDAGKARERFVEEYEQGIKEVEQARDKKIEELRGRKDIDPQQMIIEIAMAEQDWQRRLETRKQQLAQVRDREINRIETDLALAVRRVQDSYKLWAVVLPPIPPLIVGLVVFLVRRSREREGVSQSRLVWSVRLAAQGAKVLAGTAPPGKHNPSNPQRQE